MTSSNDTPQPSSSEANKLHNTKLKQHTKLTLPSTTTMIQSKAFMSPHTKMLHYPLPAALPATLDLTWRVHGYLLGSEFDSYRGMRGMAYRWNLLSKWGTMVLVLQVRWVQRPSNGICQLQRLPFLSFTSRNAFEDACSVQLNGL